MVTLYGSVHGVKSKKTLCHPRFHSGSQRVNKQHHSKVLLNSFSMNGHILGFCVCNKFVYQPLHAFGRSSRTKKANLRLADARLGFPARSLSCLPLPPKIRLVLFPRPEQRRLRQSDSRLMLHRFLFNCTSKKLTL